MTDTEALIEKVQRGEELTPREWYELSQDQSALAEVQLILTLRNDVRSGALEAPERRPRSTSSAWGLRAAQLLLPLVSVAWPVVSSLASAPYALAWAERIGAGVERAERSSGWGFALLLSASLGLQVLRGLLGRGRPGWVADLLRRPAWLAAPVLFFCATQVVIQKGEADRRGAVVRAEKLLTARRWIAFDPPGYRLPAGDQPAVEPSDDEVRAMLEALATGPHGGFDGLITFRSGGLGRALEPGEESLHQRLPRLARAAGFQAVLMGVSVDLGEHAETLETEQFLARLDESVRNELDAAIAVQEEVDAYVVGHNVSGRVPRQALEGWIARLRRETGKPVTTTASIRHYVGERGADLRRIGDFYFPDVMIPWHLGTTPLEAYRHFTDALTLVQELPGDVPVLLAMVGLPSGGAPGLTPENQQAFLKQVCLNSHLPPRVYLSIGLSNDLPRKSGAEWHPGERYLGLIDEAGTKKPAFDTVLEHWPTNPRP